MNKSELEQRLKLNEWDDFEVKAATPRGACQYADPS
jgi:hypothetical protein